MFKFSQRSLNNLKGVHPKMVKVLTESIKTSPIDFVVVEGVRSDERQNACFKAGKSKCDGYIKKGNHQIKKDGYGYAVDLYPLPIQYNDPGPYIILAKHIKATAKKLGIEIVWGGDWKTLVDRPHYELKLKV